MVKEEYATPLIDEYNQKHRTPRRSHGKWFEPYLPAGLRTGDIGSAKEKEMLVTFRETELEAEKYLLDLANRKFRAYFLETFNIELLEYLPKKPEPMDWNGLADNRKKDLIRIFNECREKGYTKKTIRKHLRSYLEG